MRKLLAYNPQPVQCTSQQRHTTRRLPSPRLPAVTPVPAYCCSAENPPRALHLYLHTAAVPRTRRERYACTCILLQCREPAERVQSGAGAQAVQ